MVFCASNPVDAKSLQHMGDVMFDQASGQHWFAVLDLAFDEGQPRTPALGASAALYATGKWRALLAASPMFYELPWREADTLSKALAQLGRYVCDRPMLSFMRSPLSLADLVARMREVIEVETSDGEPFVLRWADTRVSPTLAHALSRDHWARLCQPLTAWHIVDRSGQVRELAMPEEPQLPPSSEVPEAPRMRLNDDELAALLTFGEPDAFISLLVDEFPELLPKENHADLFHEVVHVCELANDCGITSTPDRLALVIANRLAGGQLWCDERLKKWLHQAAWSTGQFNAALGEFVETLE
jgi:hypothetical protein